MEEVKKAILVEYDKENFHQHIKIDNIEIAMHYNYLVDTFFLSVWGGDEAVANNIPIVPNVNLFENLFFPYRENEDQKALGDLTFSYHDKIKIGKDDLGKFEIFYMGESVVYS